MVKFFKTPFASNGDKLNIPEELQEDGSISFDQGYGEDYEKNRKTDPDAKNISRQSFNGLLHDITDAIGDIQRSGVAKWSDEVTYSKGSLVWHNKSLYSSLLDSNKSQPPSASWTTLLTEKSLDLSEYRKKDDLSYEDGRLLTNKEIINDWDQASDENVFSAGFVKDRVVNEWGDSPEKVLSQNFVTNEVGNHLEISAKSVNVTGSGAGSGSHHLFGKFPSNFNKGGGVVAIGSSVLANSTSGNGCVAIGDGALSKGINPRLSTAVGFFSQHNSSSDRNDSLGSLSLFGLTTGQYNVGVGRDAGQCLTEGSRNTILGYSSARGFAPIDIYGNISIGYEWKGDDNTYIGDHSGAFSSINSSYNVAIGSGSQRNAKRVFHNVAIGYLSQNKVGSSKSFNNKDLITSNLDTTYSIEDMEVKVVDARNIVTVGNYVRISFSSGSLATYSKDSQLIYVKDVFTGGFTLDLEYADFFTSGGNCKITSIELSTGNSSGDGYNVSVGSMSAENLASGTYSVMIGTESARKSENTSSSVSIGGLNCHNADSLSASVSIGYRANGNNTSFQDSVSIGYQSMRLASKVTGSSCIGYESLNSPGIEVTATVSLGTRNGLGIVSKSNRNTFLGNSSGRNSFDSLTNSTCIGYSSNVTGDNQVQLGNADTTTYVFGTVQNRSDARDKKDIKELELGLDFVMKLKPKQFKWNYREWEGKQTGKRDHVGFIAQELQEVLKDTNYAFVQDHKVNGGSDVYSVGYDEFIGVLTKSIQEQQKQIEELKAELSEIKQKL